MRLKQHNQGMVDHTKSIDLGKMIYFEGYESEEAARLRERKLKQCGSAWGHLKKIRIIKGRGLLHISWEICRKR